MASPMDIDEYFNLENEQPKEQMGEDDRETDPRRLQQRQKQIDFGKNTLGYTRYSQEVPREKRRRRIHPNTPDITRKWSKRQFDGLVKAWRRSLHRWDPEAQAARDNEGPAPAIAGSKRERDEPRGGARQPPSRPKEGRADGPKGEVKDKAPRTGDLDDWVYVESPAKKQKGDQEAAAKGKVEPEEGRKEAPAKATTVQKEEEEDDDEWFKDL